MTEGKYTPAPWRVRTWDNPLCISIEEKNRQGIPRQLAAIHPGHSSATLEYLPREEQEANAILIATSPDLLDALRWALKWVAPPEYWPVYSGDEGAQMASRAELEEFKQKYDEAQDIIKRALGGCD